jgi:hypothetical protein
MNINIQIYFILLTFKITTYLFSKNKKTLNIWTGGERNENKISKNKKEVGEKLHQSH